MEPNVHLHESEAEGQRQMLCAKINSLRADRDQLEVIFDDVLDTVELQMDYKVVGFLAPFVFVERKSDNMMGVMTFQHIPRFYFNWTSVEDMPGVNSGELRQYADNILTVVVDIKKKLTEE